MVESSTTAFFIVRVHRPYAARRSRPTETSLHFVNVVHDATRNADNKYGQIANRFVLDASRDVNDHTLVKFDFRAVERHRSLAIDDVIKLVGLGVVVQFGVMDFDDMHLPRRAVLLIDQTTNLAAGLRSRPDLGRVATQEAG